MKKIISLLLIVSAIFSLTACGISPETAVWEGYDEVTFVELLDNALSPDKEENPNVALTVRIECEKGWSSSELSENDVSSGATPYTYIASFYDDESVKQDLEFYYYMELDRDKLSAVGSMMLYDDEKVTGNKEETERVLNGYKPVSK